MQKVPPNDFIMKPLSLETNIENKHQSTHSPALSNHFFFLNKTSATELKSLHFSYYPYFSLSLLALDFFLIIQEVIFKRLEKIACGTLIHISL